MAESNSIIFDDSSSNQTGSNPDQKNNDDFESKSDTDLKDILKTEGKGDEDTKSTVLPKSSEENNGVSQHVSNSIVDGIPESSIEINKTNDSLEPQKMNIEEGDIKLEDENIDNQNEEEMDVIEHLDSSLLYQNPTFAEICSFFNSFTHLLGLKPISIAKLDKFFCTLINGDVDSELIDLHVTLMRKIYLKSARADKWEKALQKFSAICPGLDNESRQLQRHHYVDISIDTKLSLLKALCDSQFECNAKFKENISNTFRNCELRIAPFGRDKVGLIYYLQIDCDLDLRVYTEEPEDEAGTSWALRARNETELIDLINSLKRPDFGKKSSEDQPDDDAEEMDEEQLLDSPKSIVKKASISSNISNHVNDTKEKTSTDIKQFKLDEAQRAKIIMQTKSEILWDCYRKQDLLNKRKLERDKQKKDHVSHTIVVEDVEIPSTSRNIVTDKEDIKNELNLSDNKEFDTPEQAISSDMKVNDTNEIDDALIAAELDAEDKRRVLPRRNARNAAISNLKLFTASPRLTSTCDSKDSAINTFKHNLAFVSTAGSNSDENSDEEEMNEVEEEEDDNENSSDDDFLLDSDERPTLRKIGKPPTKRKIIPKKKGNKKKQTKKGKKLDGRASRIAALQRASIALGAANRKKLSAFAIDESSDDEDAEPDEEEKERKRATELSLCQHCKGVNRPDLLLLCDNCDDAWHTFCLRPQLWYVPDGNWFCPPCEHNSLINRLIYALLMLRDNKKIQDQQKKKEAAADRLKREMDFIGISLNNIIPSGIKKDDGHVNTSSTEDSDESGDGQYLQRKSKKRAMKIVTSKSRLQRRAMEQIEHLCPIVTVAEGRSRRAMKRVDYNFRSYDEQLQEAMHSIDPDAKLNDSEMSESEAGRGKDIQNTYIAGEQQKDIRDKSDDNEEESDVPARKRDAPARPPKGRVPKVNNKTVKKNKRLTDLDVDDVTESDTDEWHESSADNVEEDPEPSEDEYLPSERTRTNRGMWSRHKSDDEFINDDSDPDYVEKSRRRAGGKKKNRTETKSKNKRRNTETSTSDDDNDIQPSASDSDAPGSNRTKNKRQKLNISSSDEEAKRLHKMTEAGRPLRRAAAKVGARLIEVDDEWENEDEEDDYVAEHETNTEDNKTGDRSDKNASVDKPILSVPSTSALENKIDLSSNDKFDDADEFMPDEMEEVEADEEEEEAEVELENEAVDDDEEDVEDESSDESSSKSSGDDGEENSANKTSNVERTIIKNKLPSPIMKVKKKLPPPRKASKNKKRAPTKIKKAGRGRGRKQTTKLENSNSKPGIEKINSLQRKRSTSLAKEPVVKGTTPQKLTETNISAASNKSPSQQSLSPQTTRQRRNPSTLLKNKICQVETNSKQQKIQELPIVSSNDNANIQKQQKSLPPQPRKIEIPLALTISEPSKEQKPEVTIPVKTLSNETVTVENEKSSKKNAPNNLNINEQTIEKTIAPPSNVEMSIKLKLEAFVKEKIQPKIEKTMTVTPANYSINPSQTATSTTTLNIPLSSSKMSTTIFQPVDPQQLSQYINNTPPPPPVTNQKQIVSTASKGSVSSSIAVQPPTLAPATRIVLQQRPMGHSTSFASFQNNTPPNVSGPQVAIMPTVLPPPMTVGLPQGCVPQFVPQPPATYFMQQGAPPQIIYQTLQPYGSVLPPHAAFPVILCKYNNLIKQAELWTKRVCHMLWLVQ
uniref:Uncharacterized protein n=1 Tax=Meloidogyne enterolobii TaxID=390850 RepID=A0A6V7XH75_MELEN|nr:unnamed protein product [Meloidogyne enterolobii]